MNSECQTFLYSFRLKKNLKQNLPKNQFLKRTLYSLSGAVQHGRRSNLLGLYVTALHPVLTHIMWNHLVRYLEELALRVYKFSHDCLSMHVHAWAK